MAKTREIKGRIKSVQNIQRITKTMQSIATARYRSALNRTTAAQPYTRKIAQLVAELASQTGGNLDHPLMRRVDPERATGRHRLLVISSNRGLCGAYNANLLKEAYGFIKRQRDENGQTLMIDLVGKKGRDYFRFTKTQVDRFLSQFSDRVSYDQVEELAEGYMREFEHEEVDSVRVAYTAYESAGRQRPTVLSLLPLEDPTEPEIAGEGEQVTAAQEMLYDFSPSAAEILRELLPITVKTQLFQCFNEAEVSEQIARMVAMKAATDAAGKMSKTLRRQYNRARQAAITTELTEIISGAQALE
jgi:F-type H+-transporting ATPase subunit gamma